MLLIQTAVLASLASAASGAPTLSGVSQRAPLWAVAALAARAPWRALQLLPACRLFKARRGVRCTATFSGPLLGALPSVSHGASEVHLPRISDGMAGTLGGFVSFDIMNALHLSVGPRVSWFTPDSPREELLRLRVVAPGWGVRYTWEEAAVSVGVATGTRFLILGEDWPVVDLLTSEASIQLLLP